MASSPVTPAPLPQPRLGSFWEQDHVIVLGMCIFGEARGENRMARLGVGGVVRNRVNLKSAEFGTSWKSVILRPYAFSCFLESDPNSKKLMNPLLTEPRSVWDECYGIAKEIFMGTAPDVTRGAVFYHDASLDETPKAFGDVERTATFGRLTFYRKKSVVRPRPPIVT